jgi:toxin-antitoxin system PIN domain toxin
MRALLDVNVLIALLDPDHSLHARATQWFATNARSGWASCPITQNGCVRVMSHPGYPNTLPAGAVMGHLAEATGSELHQFWSDDISLLNPDLIDRSRVHGPRQLTDLYLLALAAHHGGCFATFDHSISAEAIKETKARDMIVL